MAHDDAQIKKLIADLDQNPDPLHGDMTPSVRKLGALGEQVIPYLEEPLSSSDENRRLHAERVLEDVLQRRFGFVAGRGWTQADGETKFVELWKRNGSYAHDAPEELRQKAVAAWMAWHQQQAGN